MRLSLGVRLLPLNLGAMNLEQTIDQADGKETEPTPDVLLDEGNI